ncbi:MAG TPA: hypothetical protein VI603_03125, partial [Saprospiraceae bacterium]|nr:hypothetical protein [Saprospiraceae bacterium]
MKRLFTLLLFYLGCANLMIGQECDINELVVEPLGCENGLFYVHVDFNVLNPDGDLFGVMGNGTDYGSFPYDSLPITLGPLEGDGVTEWEFVVFDENNPDCQAVFVLGIVQCCGFNEIVIDPTECTNQEVFNAILNFNHFGTGGLGFDVFAANGEALGFFEYDDLPVTVMGIPSVDGFTHITFCDNDNQDCCGSIEFESLDCNNNDCEIFNVDVLIGDCENGEFFVTLSFNYENVGPGFTVHGNGNDYGTFEYGDLPITLGPLEGDGETVYEFVVSDTEFDGCSDFAVIEPVLCPQACGFDEVNIDPLECQGEGYYILGLDFFPVETGDDGFSVFTQGMLLGSFSYDELPVFIDSFPSSCDFIDVLTICDNAHPDCCETHEFNALLCCEDCLIYDLVAEHTECDSNDQFYVVLNFQYLNVSDQGFSVGGNGNDYGDFNYEDLPITLGPFDGDGVTFYEFGVTDLVDGECSDGIGLGVINCACGFEEITVDVMECTGNGTYSLLLDFIPVDVTNQGFDVYGVNQFVGYFLYENLPVVIENFPDGDGPIDVITICDNDNPSCCASLEFEEDLDCGCDIFDLVAEAFECDDETNTFALYIDFGWEGNTETFHVYKGDLLIGTVEGANLPDTIYGLTDDGGGALISVCSTNFPDCCQSVEIDVPQCGEEPCDIFELVAEAFECDTETNTFALYIDFQWTGNDEVFNVFKGNVQIGEVLGANLPDTLYGLTDDGGGALITVCADNHPDCCASIEIDVPQCGEESCDIFELVAEAFECDPETNTFALYIDFQWTGNDEVFNVFKGNVQIGEVLGANLPDTLYGLTDDGGGALITVCADNHPDCCASIEIDVPQCGEESCDIFELVAEAFECDPETNTFALYIDFQWTGNVEVFNVYKGNVLIGEVLGANLPDTLYGLTDDGGGALITVCADNHPDCCASIEIDVPQCGEEPCDIFELDVDVSDCNPETNTFFVVINFQWTGNAELFDVYKGDTFIGTIAGADLPATIDGLTDDGGGALFTVCAHENQDCCQSVEVSVPQCGEEPCDIFELVAEAFECDPETNTFALYIDFQWTGNVEVFNVYKGNVQIGEVLGAHLPDTLYGLTDDGGGALITVCADNHPDCCASLEIAVPDCGVEECEIFEVVVDPGECTSDSTFHVAITYSYQGFTNEFVEVWTGDTYLGLFHVDIQPIVINNFPWNGQEVMPLRICENDHPDCCRTVEFEVPDCLALECGIFEINVDVLDCSSDSTFVAWVNFEAQGFDGPVQIWADDTYLGLFPQDLPLLVTNIPENDGGILLTICQAENQDCCAETEFQGLVCENIGSIDNLTVTISECDEGTFATTMDFDFENVSDSFRVGGNGNLYGTFTYNQVPLTIGPFPGDNVTQWEFIVSDQAHPFVADYVNVGLVDCTTGISGPGETKSLEIRYSSLGAYFIVPADVKEFSMWTYDGRMITA